MPDPPTPSDSHITPPLPLPLPPHSPTPLPPRRKLRDRFGPGLIAGASDDDPSGIATYSQAGAQFGYGLGWVMLFSLPLMCAIQEISARIGRVTGRGIAGNLRRHYPKWPVRGLVALLLIANTINLGADLGAMAAALELVVGGPKLAYVALFAAVSVLLEVFVRYARYVAVLKWLTLSLFAYVGVALVVDVPWATVARAVVVPRLPGGGALTVVVAILGTTISPYLFFWQAEEEVEDTIARPHAAPLIRAPGQAPAEFARIRFDTYVGMAFSNLVALFIIVTTAATLHAHGVTDIATSAQAAEALRPIAGPFVFAIFALGIVGTGMLALPVLAGSAAYAVGEVFGTHVGLARPLRHAQVFYGLIAGATVLGAVAVNFSSLDAIKALFWTAVINGVVAVPIMAMIMALASRRDVMGDFALPRGLKAIGWTATAVMAAAAAGMFATI